MIKESFLVSLIGLSRADAEKAVFLEGHEFQSVPVGSAIAAIALPNTVFIMHRDDKVARAFAGDPKDLTAPE